MAGRELKPPTACSLVEEAENPPGRHGLEYRVTGLSLWLEYRVTGSLVLLQHCLGTVPFCRRGNGGLSGKITQACK